ncbi:YHS domain-containing protein [Promicromonospora iranensis]|uniref:YHS domain-containing protein n=1 Tax=Promicromonospora iranensis TaxID=1105144 RepID=UPI0031585A83
MGHDHAHGDHQHGDHQHGEQAEGAHCGGHAHSTATSPHGTNLLGPSAEELAECPVMRGSTVVKADAEAKGLFRDYEGQRYWFCCAGCEAPFDADPAKYAAAV